MLAAESRARAAEAVRGIITKTIAEYKDAMGSERDFVSAHLQPGQRMPEIRTLTGSRREAFVSRVDGYRDEAMAELQALRDAIDAEVTAPPSDEAIRALTALRMRKNVSEAEMSAFMRRYGDNYQIRQALGDSDLLDGSEVESILESVGRLEDDVTRLVDADALLDGRNTIGSLSFSSMFIPQAMGVAVDDGEGSEEDVREADDDE